MASVYWIALVCRQIDIVILVYGFMFTLVNCPIARVRLQYQFAPACECVRLGALSHGRISGSIFTKLGTKVTTPKSNNEFVEVNITPPVTLFYP